MTSESEPIRDRGRIAFAPRPDDEELGRSARRRNGRERGTRLKWYVLFAIPTLALLAMAAWVVLGGSNPPAQSARPRTGIDVEATVKTVDVDGPTVHLTSDMLGIFGATLYLTNNTRIELANGQQGKLSDLQEGMLVRASYDLSEGRKMATRIVALGKEADADGRPRQETGQTSPGGRSGAGPSAPGRR